VKRLCLFLELFLELLPLLGLLFGLSQVSPYIFVCTTTYNVYGSKTFALLNDRGECLTIYLEFFPCFSMKL